MTDEIFDSIANSVKELDKDCYKYMIKNKDTLINTDNEIVYSSDEHIYAIKNFIQTINRIAYDKLSLDKDTIIEDKLMNILEQLKAIRSTTINFIS